MERISWLNKVTNEVLRRANEDRKILNSVWQGNTDGLPASVA